MIYTLKSWREIGDCSMKLQESGGPLHHVPQKNWDLYHMLKIIADYVDKDGSILDVGAAGCPVLEALLRRGYSNLYGIDSNIRLKEKFNRVVTGALHRRDFRILYGFSPIRLKTADLCNSSFNDNMFDAVTSLSVIEHGVPLDKYYREMARIIKPGGHLITSTDYWHTPVNATGIRAYGAPIKVFTPDEVKAGISLAFEHGFKEIIIKIPDCDEACVTWNGMKYTFLLYVLQKL